MSRSTSGVSVMKRNFSLYYAALRADEVFSRELRRAYGPREACERRYQMAAHTDVGVQMAAHAKRIADAEWLAEMRRNINDNAA